jgi:hypothetical protein
VINTPLQGIQFLRQFIKEGGLTISTECSINNSFINMRTSIQLDGSVINFVPDINCFSQEEQRLLQNDLSRHLDKIKQLLEKMNSFSLFLQRIFVGLSIGNGIIGTLVVDIHNSLGKFHPFLSYLYEINPYLVNLFWFMISSAMGGLIFHYIVQPLIWRFIAKKVREKL